MVQRLRKTGLGEGRDTSSTCMGGLARKRHLRSVQRRKAGEEAGASILLVLGGKN